MPDTVPSWPTTTLATSARSRSMAARGSRGGGLVGVPLGGGLEGSVTRGLLG